MKFRERTIGAALLLSIAGSVGFMYAFYAQTGAQWQGFALVCVFAGLTIAAIGYAQWILPPEQVTDLRDTYPCSPEEREKQVEVFTQGMAQITRRKWLLRMLYTAFGM